jgi:hypothetical protein
LTPVTATVSCLAGDGQITVDYSQYPDMDSMYAAYNERVNIAQIDTDSGLCFSDDGGTISATANKWPAEHPYSVSGSARGRYLCRGVDFPTIAWTDDGLLILGVATASPELIDGLVTFWVNEAGPIQ